MAIAVTGSQFVSFTFPGVINMAQRFILAWVNIRDFGSSVALGVVHIAPTTDNVDESMFFGLRTTANIGMTYGYTTADKSYRSTAAISLGVRHIAVYYDNTSALNVPDFYIDGAKDTTTTVNAGIGTIQSGSAATVKVGDSSSNDNDLLSLCWYDGSLYTSAQRDALVAEAYSGKKAIPDRRGLIFAPALWGNAGNVGEGGVIAAGNTIADNVTGVLGVASGSPLFKGDTVLTFGG